MTASITVGPLLVGSWDGYNLLSFLHERAFAAQGERAWNPDEFRQLVESPGVHVFIAQEQDTPVGYILIRVVCDEAELISLAVDPAWQKRGIGHQILNKAIEFLRNQHVAKFFLEVRDDNVSAINLYSGAGFEPVGRRPGYYQTQSGNYKDALCLALFLTD